MTTEEVIKSFCRVVDISGFARLSLKEKPNIDCIFWEEDGCTIYESRPLQCRSYPFWSMNLAYPQAWANTGSSCPGIGKGRLHSKESIDRWISQREAERLIIVDD